MPEVSVIVPIFNMERYLKQCLDSLVKQTLGNELELILVNDGSTDSSIDMIESYAARFSNIRVVDQENRGLAGARVSGLEAARGNYIGFVDADDFVRPEMFEEMLTAALMHGADLVSVNYSFYPKEVRNKKKWFKPFRGQVDWNFIERNTQPWNKLISRRLMIETDLIEKIREGSDGAYISVLLHASRIITIEKELYCYRVGQASMSTSYSDIKKYLNNIEMTKGQKQYLKGTPYEDSLEDYFDYRIIYSILQAMIISCGNGDKAAYKALKSELAGMRFRENCYTSMVLKHNHGFLKYLFLNAVLPVSFGVSKVICKYALTLG